MCVCVFSRLQELQGAGPMCMCVHEHMHVCVEFRLSCGVVSASVSLSIPSW